MPTKKEVLCFPADADLLKRIDDYRYENRIPSRSEAMRRLIEEGLQVQGKEAGKPKKPHSQLLKSRPST
jgi:metal-responsive CopG/Arc/MetJ family transcriptional regulator